MPDKSVTPSGRLLWIDYARFMSLFPVISYHVPVTLTDYPYWLFYLLRLPGFVFISGLLFRFEKYPSFTDYLKHRSKQLLIPYFCFILIFYVLWLAARIVLKTGDADVPVWQLGKPFWAGLRWSAPLCGLWHACLSCNAFFICCSVG